MRKRARTSKRAREQVIVLKRVSNKTQKVKSFDVMVLRLGLILITLYLSPHTVFHVQT